MRIVLLSGFWGSVACGARVRARVLPPWLPGSLLYAAGSAFPVAREQALGCLGAQLSLSFKSLARGRAFGCLGACSRLPGRTMYGITLDSE